MAQKVTVALEDDLDGGPADETVRFGLDGTEYEIDLSAKNARTFRMKVTPFVEHARKAAQRRGPGVGQGPRYRGQRPRPDPRQRDRAVPCRRQRALNKAQAADCPAPALSARSPSVCAMRPVRLAL
jgi:hypothetical protein